jgi:Icc-related predicted phosphoesterase
VAGHEQRLSPVSPARRCRSERLATPIAEFGADLVLHGHAHAGSFQGCIGEIPVYNVAVHVTGRNFWIVELDGSSVRRGGEVVEVREPE